MRIAFLLLTVACCTPTLRAQDRTSLSPQHDTVEIHIRLLDGKTGKPVAGKEIFFDRKARLLSHREEKEVLTDADGVASAVIPATGTLLDPVVVDYVLCTKATPVPNGKGKAVQIAIAPILSTGFIAANRCGHVDRSPAPGELVLYVRSPNLLERMTD